MTSNKLHNSDEKHMKIKFNLDNDLPLKKSLELFWKKSSC